MLKGPIITRSLLENAVDSCSNAVVFRNLNSTRCRSRGLHESAGVFRMYPPYLELPWLVPSSLAPLPAPFCAYAFQLPKRGRPDYLFLDEAILPDQISKTKGRNPDLSWTVVGSDVGISLRYARSPHSVQEYLLRSGRTQKIVSGRDGSMTGLNGRDGLE